MEERKRFAEGIRIKTKQAHLNNDNDCGGIGGAGVVSSSMFPKSSPPSAFSLPNSSFMPPKTIPHSTFALSNSSSLPHFYLLNLPVLFPLSL